MMVGQLRVQVEMFQVCRITGAVRVVTGVKQGEGGTAWSPGGDVPGV